jgi:hypothetical protein
MRYTSPAARIAGLILLVAAPAYGQENTEAAARAIIERAVKAHGGPERLGRARADKVKLRGSLSVPGKDGPMAMPFTAETTVQLPSQFKNVVQVGTDPKHVLVQVLDGEKAYVVIDEQTQKVEPSALNEMRETLYLDRAVRLMPLLNDRNFNLSTLGEGKVNGAAALVVRVTSRGHKEIRLSFDKESALLIKTEHVLDDAAGKEVKQEEYYSDFVDAGGYRRPRKMAAFRDGKKMMEAELVEVKYFDRIPAEEFIRP